MQIPLSEVCAHVGAGPGDAVEVCLAGSFKSVVRSDFSRVFCNRARGMIGIESQTGGGLLRLSPTQMIAGNFGFDKSLSIGQSKHFSGLSRTRKSEEVRAFSARQYLLYPDADRRPVELYRGSVLVADTPSCLAPRAAKLAGGIGHWMIANMSADGRLPYKYWPSRGKDSPADNAIRRFLATLGLARLAKASGSAAAHEAATRNLKFNLNRYFRNIGDGRGAIVEQGQAKLGAAALAGLAILELSHNSRFGEELEMLMNAVKSLVDGESGFRTFFFPRSRDGENWNFYSGEALLFLAETLRRGHHLAPSLRLCASAFERCRAKHALRRNPAFVPWHTQACASLFLVSGRREFSDFILEMNDWLLSMQQWEGLTPDLRGRFYNPRRPDFGPPHAASTGAYLEGLADAAMIAGLLGDHERESSYDRALRRGMRSLRQLQFRDRRDAFYVTRHKRVLGALRTEVYDNSVRVDSAAHALLAAIKALQRPGQSGSRILKVDG